MPESLRCLRDASIGLAIRGGQDKRGRCGDGVTGVVDGVAGVVGLVEVVGVVGVVGLVKVVGVVGLARILKECLMAKSLQKRED